MPGHTATPLSASLRTSVRNVLSNSFGFGGNCSSLLLMNAA